MFAHQFSSIAGAGPVTGAIQAAAFGWLPVLLWVLLGGIFFGAVTDFGALYASVKNDGKSMGMLIEKYIGKTGRKLFLLFCWLFCGIVIAAFADMVAGTFNAYGADGALVEAAQTNGAAGMVSIMFMVFAVIFGLLQKNLHFTGWKENVISIPAPSRARLPPSCTMYCTASRRTSAPAMRTSTVRWRPASCSAPTTPTPCTPTTRNTPM